MTHDEPSTSVPNLAPVSRRRRLSSEGVASPASVVSDAARSRRFDRLHGLRHWREAGGPAAGGAGAPSLAADDMRALVDAAREGDESALDDLVRATYGGTYTLAYRLTGNEDDARDVVQDAYLRAYRGLRRFRGDAQFTTWLYRITANCSANLLAKRARHRTETLADDEPVIDLRPEIDPESRLAGSDERARIAAALAQLPWRLRQVIVLRDIYDLAHGAIAKELGITEAAAKVRLHRARRRLRDLLAAEGTDAGAGYAVRTAGRPAEGQGRGRRDTETETDYPDYPDANAG
ncbi:MAG TPA: sigma-70 family RNA polymerase sigma factor [Acidimicrobiales bacterium]|nr:sigma-70 family RNA polymerase sigma factor [Acidimicrobiales bacterium]